MTFSRDGTSAGVRRVGGRRGRGFSPLLSREAVSRLSPVDGRTFRSGMTGTIEEGLYRPKRRGPGSEG